MNELSKIDMANLVFSQDKKAKITLTVLGESKRSLKASYVYLPEKDKVLNKRLKKMKTA